MRPAMDQALVCIQAGQPPVSLLRPAGDQDEFAKAVKRPRLVWTPQLHQRFVDAVRQLGVKSAVPKTIMQVRGRRPCGGLAACKGHSCSKRRGSVGVSGTQQKGGTPVGRDLLWPLLLTRLPHSMVFESYMQVSAGQLVVAPHCQSDETILKT